MSDALQSPDTPSKDIGKLSKELGRLTPAVEMYNQYLSLMESQAELETLRDTCDATKPVCTSMWLAVAGCLVAPR